MIDDAFWKDKRVLVTGHSGFIGGWLCTWLASKGAEVTGVALTPAVEPSFFSSCRVAENIAFSHIQDICDAKNLDAVLSSYEFDLVFHLAAQSLVKTGYLDPLGTFSTNVIGTANVLNSLRSQKSLRAVLVVTTDKVYRESSEVSFFNEQSPLGGNDPYSASKAACEFVVTSFKEAFFSERPQTVRIATVRAGNIFGGGDWAEERILPDCVRSYLNDQPLCLRRPKAIRPWQHVLNPLYGFLLFAQHLYTSSEPVTASLNFGPPDFEHISVETLVSKLCLKLPISYTVAADTTNFAEVSELRLDSSAAQRVLGWKPLLDLSDGLAALAEWVKCYQVGDDIRACTLAQIQNFERRACN